MRLAGLLLRQLHKIGQGIDREKDNPNERKSALCFRTIISFNAINDPAGALQNSELSVLAIKKTTTGGSFIEQADDNS